MKNKKLTYLLLVLVLIIWGLVFYRVFSKSGADSFGKTKSNRIISVDESMKSDSFSIVNNYPDPFKITFSSMRGNNGKGEGDAIQTNGVNNYQQQNIEQVIWPEVIYKGEILNEKTKQTTVIISVNGVSYLTPIGKMVGIVEIISLATDSIQLRYNKSTRYFKKQK